MSYTGLPASRPAWLRYLAALLSVALGWLLRTALTPAIGPTALPYITFFPALAWAAWYGGLGPAVVTVLLSVLTAEWFFFAPVGGFRLEQPVALAAFAIAGGFIVAAIETSHRARQQLARARDTFQTTLRSIGDAVVTTDAAGNVTFLNAVAEDLTGWPLAEAAGRPLAEVFRIVNEATRAEVENPAVRAMRDGTIVGLANHTLLLPRTGPPRAIDDSAAPIRGASGEVIGSVLVFRDIGPRREAEHSLRQGEEYSRSVIDHVLDGIIAIDEAGRIDSFNRAAERIFGYPASEVIGRNVKVLMPEPFHGEHDRYLRNYLETGTAKVIGIGRQVEGRRKDGSTFPLDLAVSEFHVGSRRFFTGIVRDITDRVEAARRMAVSLERETKAREEAERTLRFGEQFVGILGHDLRNPISAIATSAEQILRSTGEPELRRTASRIESVAQRMSRMIDQLLDFTRIRLGSGIQLEPRGVDLKEISREIADETRAAHGRDVVVESDGSTRGRWDGDRLAQVLSNLLANAAQHGEPAPPIRVRIDGRDAATVRFDVRNGGEVSSSILPVIFEPFRERSAGRGTGLGLGLYITKEIVTRHGGAITVESANGETCFRVTLPRTS